MTVPYAWRSLMHDSGKLAIGAAGVAAALILMLLLSGFRSGLYESISAYATHAGADLFVGQDGATGIMASSSAIRSDLRERIREAADASAIQAITVTDVIFDHSGTKTPVLVMGYAPGRGMGGPWSIVLGREPQIGESEILLDQWLATRCRIEIGQDVSILGQSLRVVGLTGGTSNWMSPMVFVPSDALDRLLGTTGIVSYFLLDLAPDTDRQAVKTSLESRFRGVHAMEPETLAEHDREVLATIMETPLMVMLGISVLIGTAVVGLTSYTAALDRMREYGILIAMGASTGKMRQWLITETYLRSAMGYALGVIGSLGAARAIEMIWPQFTVTIEPAAFLLVGLATLVMAALGTLLSLYRVEGLDPGVVFGA